MKSRRTLSLDPDVAARLDARAAEVAGGNASAYIARLVMADALAESVEQHAGWYGSRPDYAETAEAERHAA